MLNSCPHEKELRQSIANGEWPNACSPELREHMTSCRACGDLALVSTTFQKARAQSLAAARPVPPALVLWRAALRRRNAAVERMGRPLLGAQIFAFAATLIAIAGFVGFEARRGAEWLTWAFWQQSFASSAQANGAGSVGFAGSGWNWLVLASVCAMLALIGGAVIYFATDKQ